MSDQIKTLLIDLQRLVQELDVAKAADEKKAKKEIKPLEGQILTRDPDTVLASKLRNAVVSSPDEQRIGEVNDLLIKADGKVAGVIVGVGGDKNIALELERFTLTPEPDGRARIVLSAKLEELQEAPAFRTNNVAAEEVLEDTAAQADAGLKT